MVIRPYFTALKHNYLNMKIASIKQILINVSRIILENIKVNSNIMMMAEMFMIVLIELFSILKIKVRK